MNRLSGQTAVITGAASGIGKGIALAFAREGAEVVVADIDSALGEATAHEIEQAGGRAIFARTDVTRPESVAQMTQATMEAFGRITILCNNTGDAVEARKSIRIVELTDSEWDETFDLGLKSIHNCCRCVIPHMIDSGGGAIINISSIAGTAPAFSAAFSAMKAGVIAITRSLAVQYADDNIRANCICPGAIRTPGGISVAKQGIYAGINNDRVRLIERFGTPEDVANAAIFLASEESSYITAASLAVDGGMLALVSNIPPRTLDSVPKRTKRPHKGH